MGLDMYVLSTLSEPATVVDFCQPKAIEELHRWRKHPNLHGWMEALYRAKGGLDDDFNLSPVILTFNDLDRLEAAVVLGTLPDTDGCFFGYSDGSERDGDLTFIAKARATIGAGMTIFYIASW